MINAIIMASGFSRRMGTNKLLLPYKGKLIVEHTIDQIQASLISYIVLVAKDEDILSIGRQRGLKVVYNHSAVKGQSESIKLGILNSPSALGYAFFTSDQPLMDHETIDYLIERFYEHKNSIIVPIYQEKRGTPVIFPSQYKEELLSLNGDTGGRELVKKYQKHVKWITVQNDSLLFDIDTIEDYRKLEMINNEK